MKTSLGPSLHGLLLVDKPQSVTSHDVVQAIRRICGTKAVGHTGTLDPLATGLMVLGDIKGMEVANQNNIPVLMIVKTDDKNT